MGRRCGRPGCGQPAVVAVGFDAARRLVWLDPIDRPPERLAGVLCQRHAQALVPPRGWWLDDRRLSTPELWREPRAGLPPSGAPLRSSGRRRPITRVAPEPGEPLPLAGAADDPTGDRVAGGTTAGAGTPGEGPADRGPSGEPGEAEVTTPLLRRAFRAQGRRS